MPSSSEHVARLLAEVADPLGVQWRSVPVVEDGDDAGWGELTGYPDQPPSPAPQGPLALVRAALGIVSAYSGARWAALPGIEVLTERAAAYGFGRNAPCSAGGHFRILPGRDGWFGVSLPRPSDLDCVPALIEAPVAGDPWAAVTDWLAGASVAEAAARTQLLGLPAAAVPARVPPPRRPSVVVAVGGSRTPRRPPLVVDLTSLWAGPLCSRLLRSTGARVVKVESRSRLDGTRRGSPQFFRLLYGDAESRLLDIDRERAQLGDLVASADIVLESSRPRALRDLGIHADEHARRGAIWVSITAYGRGPGDEMRVGFGDDVAAGAGLVAWTDGRPIPVGDAVADPLAGVTAAAAAAVAQHSVWGALIDVSMHDVAVAAAS